MNIFKRIKEFIISLLNDTHGEILSADDSVYVINGVRYIVSVKHSETESMTFIDKIKRYLGSDFAHLTTAEDINTINTECVCVTAGKED